MSGPEMYFEALQDLGRAFANFASLHRLLLKVCYFGRWVIAILDVIWMHVELHSLQPQIL